MASAQKIHDDEFAMWRAVFAFALVDGFLTLEKQNILAYHLQDIPFNLRQIKILREDMRSPQNVSKLYGQIENKKHKKHFCELARTLSWCNGDIDRQEKEVLKHLSCFKSADKDFLKESASTPWMKKFTDKYEEIAFMIPSTAHTFFEMHA